MTRVESLFWQISMVCAVLLRFAPLTPRTSWSFDRGQGTGRMTHSAGWDWVAPMCGLIAIALLLVGGGLRLEGWRTVWGSILAFLALAIAAAAAWGHWIDLKAGRLALANSTVNPAVGFFAAAGAIGALAALALTVCWLLRPA